MLRKKSAIRSTFLLALMCSVFSFGVIAQTNSDKPMNAKSLAALVAELKEVVAKNTPDEKEAAAVAVKLDARQDLAGKTKKDVINLLYGDVKAIIKDSGVLYQIYSIFSFYKTIPDEPQSAQTPTNNAVPSKSAAVKKLIDLTFPTAAFQVFVL